MPACRRLFSAALVVCALLGAGALAALDNPDDACVERTVVEHPVLRETSLWAPIVATPTRLYRFAYNVETFDRRRTTAATAQGGWGGAHLVGLSRPAGYKGGMSLGAVVVTNAATPAGATAVWVAHWATKDIQELVLPADATDTITVTTRVGAGTTAPTAAAPLPGANASLWHLGSIAHHNGTAYSVTHDGGPATGAIVVVKTDAPFNTWAFEAAVPCQARAIAMNSAHRLFVVCYEHNARVVRVDLDAATGLPKGSYAVIGTAQTGSPAPHVAAIAGPEAHPTLYASTYLQELVAVSISADYNSTTAARALAHDGKAASYVLALHAVGNDVIAARGTDHSAVVLRCTETASNGTCARQELVTEWQVRAATEYSQVLVNNNTVYQFSGQIRVFRRDAPGQALAFHKQFAPVAYDTSVVMPVTGSAYYVFTQGAVWIPGAAKLTAWVGGSTARRIFEVVIDNDDTEPAVTTVAGGGATAPTIGGTAVAGALAQLTYVAQLAVGGEFVFFGPGLAPQYSPSSFTRVGFRNPHEVEVFPHPCVFRAIAAHTEVLYSVCWEGPNARVMALSTDAWRPTGVWAVIYTLPSSWQITPNIGLTDGGSVLWVARWGGPVAKLVLNISRRVEEATLPLIGGSTPRALTVAGRDLWLTSHNTPFEFRCVRADATPAPAPTLPETPAPGTPAPSTPAPNKTLTPGSSSSDNLSIALAAAGGGLAVIAIGIVSAVVYVVCCRGPPKGGEGTTVKSSGAAEESLPIAPVTQFGQSPIEGVPVVCQPAQPEQPPPASDSPNPLAA